MLYIDAEECIDCCACVPECPVEAIFIEGEVPARWTQFIALNAERAKAIKTAGQGPIVQKQEPKMGLGCGK